MDGHEPLTLNSLSLFRFVYVLYMWNQCILLNTFCRAWFRLVMLCHELLSILGFDLQTVSMTLFDAT
jgi:hypothetical protein